MLSTTAVSRAIRSPVRVQVRVSQQPIRQAHSLRILASLIVVRGIAGMAPHVSHRVSTDHVRASPRMLSTTAASRVIRSQEPLSVRASRHPIHEVLSLRTLASITVPVDTAGTDRPVWLSRSRRSAQEKTIRVPSRVMVSLTAGGGIIMVSSEITPQRIAGRPYP